MTCSENKMQITYILQQRMAQNNVHYQSKRKEYGHSKEILEQIRSET